MSSPRTQPSMFDEQKPAFLMNRSDLPEIKPSDVHVQNVPAHLQESIRELIIKKANQRIQQEMDALKADANAELDAMRQQYTTDGQRGEAYYGGHPYGAGYAGHPGYGGHPAEFGAGWDPRAHGMNGYGRGLGPHGAYGAYGYPGHLSGYPHGAYGYGHVPYGVNHPSAKMTAEEEKKYIAALKQAGGVEPYARKATGSPSRGAVRARMLAYDNSIKTDILLAGRDRSMNITYEPYYHGPYNPTLHGAYAYGPRGMGSPPREGEGTEQDENENN